MVTEGPIRVPVTQRIAGPEERIYTHNVTPECQRAWPTVPAKAERGKVDWPSVPHLLMRCCLRSSCSVWMARFFKTVDRCTSSCSTEVRHCRKEAGDPSQWLSLLDFQGVTIPKWQTFTFSMGKRLPNPSPILLSCAWSIYLIHPPNWVVAWGA